MVDGQARRLAVRVDGGLARGRSRVLRSALKIATRGRAHAERRGVALAELLACDAHGPDRTELSGCAKLYLPPGDGRRPSVRSRSCSSLRGRPMARSLGVRRLRDPPPRRRSAERLRTPASPTPSAIPVMTSCEYVGFAAGLGSEFSVATVRGCRRALRRHAGATDDFSTRRCRASTTTRAGACSARPSTSTSTSS